MKVLLVILFAFTTPLVVFLTTVLYGGISARIVKEELASSSFYSELAEQITSFASDDNQTDELIAIVKNRVTPEYIEEKFELTIDTSYAYITNSSTVPPTISFKEIKDDIVDKNPQLLTDLEKISQDMAAQQEAIIAEDIDYETTSTSDPQAGIESFMSLVKNDFTFNLSTYLKGVKNMYAGFRIVHPLLLVLLFVYLVLLSVFATSWKARLKWIGSAFLFSSAIGFVIVLFHRLLISSMSSLTFGDENKVILIVRPIITQIISYFITTNSSYQTITSSIMLAIGVGAIGISIFVVKENTLAISKQKLPAKKK